MDSFSGCYPGSLVWVGGLSITRVEDDSAYEDFLVLSNLSLESTEIGKKKSTFPSCSFTYEIANCSNRIDAMFFGGVDITMGFGAILMVITGWCGVRDSNVYDIEQILCVTFFSGYYV